MCASLSFSKLSATNSMQIEPLFIKISKKYIILTVGGIHGISNFKSRASPLCVQKHCFLGSIISFFFCDLNFKTPASIFKRAGQFVSDLDQHSKDTFSCDHVQLSIPSV